MTRRRQPLPAGRYVGKPLTVNKSSEARYRGELEDQIGKMRRETERQLATLARIPNTAMDGPSLASQARILVNALRKRFEAAFARQATPLAERFTARAAKNSATTLEVSLKELSRTITIPTNVVTPAIREVMKATVAANVDLIKSLPSQYYTQVQGAVMRSIQQGDGTADILRAVEAIGGVTQRRAALIARDQTSKANTALNAARLKAMGVRKFQWLHSGGGLEPRPLHEAMSGKTYSLDDPPVIDEKTGEKGLPGQLINCRCRMGPVLDFSAK